MMDRETVRNIEFYSKIKYEKLVHLVSFIIRLQLMVDNSVTCAISSHVSVCIILTPTTVKLHQLTLCQLRLLLG